MLFTPKAASRVRISLDEKCWCPTFIRALRGATSREIASAFLAVAMREETRDSASAPAVTPIPARVTNFLRFIVYSFASLAGQRHWSKPGSAGVLACLLADTAHRGTRQART